MQQLVKLFVIVLNILSIISPRVRSHNVQKCHACEIVADELSTRLANETPRNHLDARHRLDANGKRWGKLIDFRISELRVIELIDGLCDEMDKYQLTSSDDEQKWILSSDAALSNGASVVVKEELKEESRVLKNQCSDIIGSWEDDIAEAITSGKAESESIRNLLCVGLGKYCPLAETAAVERSKDELFQQGECGLVDSATYKITYVGTAERQCQGSYLSYKKEQGDGVLLLNKGIGAISMPGVWQVNKKGSQIIALKAISIPGRWPPKIGYSFRGCSSTTVKLNSVVDLYTLWKLVPVNGTISDLYQIIPDQLSGCKSMSYTLGIKKKGSSGAASLSSCGHSIGLVANGSLNSSVSKIYWKFTRVKSPPPKPSLPPPQPAFDKTRVVATTLITQPNGQSCSSLSQEELRNITTTLCIRQIDYITTILRWSRQQTDCLGTARCGGARQSTGASEHITDLSLIHTTSQNQTAEEVATSLTEAMNKPQTFYLAADFAPNTDITLSDTSIIPPGGAPTPSSPSSAPSPTPAYSPNPTPAPIFVPSPTPTPTPSGGGGGGGGGSPPITAPGVPISAVFTVNTASVGTINAAWVAPAATSGAAVAYDILCTVNTGTAPPLITGVSATSHAITGLTPGSTYTCSVRATNSAGSSAYSIAVTGLAIPAVIPGVPTSAVFTVDSGAIGMINAAWVAPAATGGAAVTYDILCTVNTGTAPPLITGVSATSYAITGLIPGSTYECSVRATNSAGSSAYSIAVTGLAIPATVPDPPTIGAFSANTGANGAANAAWTATANDGGAALTSYSVMCTPNAGPAVTATGILTSTPICSGSVCSTIMTGLANTGTYSCKVQAVNSVGSSAYSGSSNSFDLSITPGAIWTLKTAISSRWWAIAYGGGIYCVVSTSAPTGNLVMTSTDGITWSSVPAPAALTWSAITYGSNQFVAVAASGTSAGQIMTSATGGSWTLRSHPATCLTWKGIAYGDGVFVAVGDSGTDRVMRSTDGITWTAVSAGVIQYNWRAVTYGGTPGAGGMFVAVAANGGMNQIMTSATGGSWTIRATAASSQLAWTSITYGGGRYLAVATDAAQTSPDGVVWTYQTGTLTGAWFGATYCGGTFAVIALGSRKIMTSADGGVNWVLRDPKSSQNWRSLACGPDKIVGVASLFDEVTTSLI